MKPEDLQISRLARPMSPRKSPELTRQFASVVVPRVFAAVLQDIAIAPTVPRVVWVTISQNQSKAPTRLSANVEALKETALAHLVIVHAPTAPRAVIPLPLKQRRLLKQAGSNCRRAASELTSGRYSY